MLRRGDGPVVVTTLGASVLDSNSTLGDEELVVDVDAACLALFNFDLLLTVRLNGEVEDFHKVSDSRSEEEKGGRKGEGRALTSCTCWSSTKTARTTR